MRYIVKGENTLNTIIISPPGFGKTTILRDIARNLSDGSDFIKGRKVSIIDERSEIASCLNGIPTLDIGKRTDVYDSCSKSEGIMMAIRTMSPDAIICDEIGTDSDVSSILSATNSGVALITTIHGNKVEDIKTRKTFKRLFEEKVFDICIVLEIKNRIRFAQIINLKNNNTEVIML